MHSPPPLQRALIGNCPQVWSKSDIFIFLAVSGEESVFNSHIYLGLFSSTFLAHWKDQASLPLSPLGFDLLPSPSLLFCVGSDDDWPAREFHFTPPHTSTHSVLSCCPPVQPHSPAPCLILHPSRSHAGGIHTRRRNYGDRSPPAHHWSIFSDTRSARCARSKVWAHMNKCLHAWFFFFPF